jgi:uncharacterized protein
MKVTGEATVGAPAESVCAALHDQAVLARAVPGCERLEIVGPGSGRFIVTTTMTAISGTYSGQLTSSQQQQPSSVDLTASISGSQGTVTADLAIRLTPAGGGATLVGYEANGVVSGAIAGVGARLLASAAKRLADEFLAALDEVIAGPAPVASITPKQAAEDASTEVVSESRIEPNSESPALYTSGAVAGRPDLKLSALVAAVILLFGIAVGILFGRRGRARASRS